MARPETEQHQQAFEAWYANGRNTLQTSTKLGIKRQTFIGWVDRYGWHERADRRDLAVSRKAEAEAIARRAKMIEDQRRVGQAMRNAGAQYLADNGKKAAKSAKDAVSLIKEGFALERQAEGIPDYVVQILNASESELRDEYTELLRSAKALGISSADGEVERLES